MKRTPRSVKKSCDKLFSKLIRKKGLCERCGNKKTLQVAHIYSRRYNSTRFDEDNALCLCSSCHFWAHQNPVDFTKWLSTFKDLDKLAEKKELLGRLKMNDWLQLESDLKEKLKKYEDKL